MSGISKDLEQHLVRKRFECVQTLLGLYKRSNAGHIGSSLSCLELLIDLYFHRLKDEDVFILSKGHAAGALYTVLAHSGRIEMNQLDTFYREGTLLAAHPPCSGKIPAIPFGTGSLGHGLSLATGIAFSQKFTGKKFQVYCVLSDGDCNEGSTWEAALFAAHHKLENLTVIIDANGLQGLGPTREILDLEPLESKWQSFGFATRSCKNGNSFSDIHTDMSFLKANGERAPRCLIAKTIKGHRVSYMENEWKWHYLPMNEAEFKTAMNEQELNDA